MAKPRRSKSRKALPTRTRAAAPRLHPLVEAADVTPEFRKRTALDAELVPNPYGEVFISGELKRHMAVRRRPAYVTLFRQGVIDRATLGALEWYAGRLATSEAGIVKGCLGGDGSGGGSSASHIPISEARIAAQGDVDWARRLIPAQARRAFDLVMVDELSFSESARRERAGVPVRASVRRLRAVMAAQFKAAAEAVRDGWLERYGARGGRIGVVHYELDQADVDAWRVIEAGRGE